MMKARTFIGMAVMLVTLAGMTACGNDDNIIYNPQSNDDNEINQVVEVTWKLYGFGTIGEDEVQKVTGEDYEYRPKDIYQIRFNDDGEIMGFTFSNDISGKYSIQGNIINILELGRSLAGERFDGEKYFMALCSGPLLFETKDDQLLLYYNEGKEYLQFDKVTYEEKPYKVFLEEGKTWKYSYNTPNGTQYMKSLVVRGDTTVNGLEYKKIYDLSTNDYQFSLREEGRKVYCKHQNRDIPELLYDFSKNTGEKVSEDRDQKFRTIVRVIEASEVKSGDRQLHRMWVSQYRIPIDNSCSGEIEVLGTSMWIEGIGSICGLDSPFQYPGNYFTFHSCWIGGEELGNNGLFW